jgi:hypothetical protein
MLQAVLYAAAVSTVCALIANTPPIEQRRCASTCVSRVLMSVCICLHAHVYVWNGVGKGSMVRFALTGLGCRMHISAARESARTFVGELSVRDYLSFAHECVDLGGGPGLVAITGESGACVNVCLCAAQLLAVYG